MTGICKVCGCTDTTPCVQEVQQESGLFVTTPCWWVDSELRDLCSTCVEEGGAEDDPYPDDHQEQQPLLYDAFDRPIDVGGRK